MSSTVVDINDYKAKKQANKDPIEVFVEAHDRVLDVAEEEFEDAVVIGILGKKILVSSTSQDKYFLEAMLEEALWSIRNEY
jgi:hypothetical protein